MWDSQSQQLLPLQDSGAASAPIPSVPDTAGWQALNSSGFSHDLMEKHPCAPCAKQHIAQFCPLSETPFIRWRKQMWELAGSLPEHSTPWHTLAHSVVTSSPSLINSFRQMWAMIPAASASPRTLIIVLNLSLENETVMVSCWLLG